MKIKISLQEKIASKYIRNLTTEYDKLISSINYFKKLHQRFIDYYASYGFDYDILLKIEPEIVDYIELSTTLDPLFDKIMSLIGFVLNHYGPSNTYPRCHSVHKLNDYIDLMYTIQPFDIPLIFRVRNIPPMRVLQRYQYLVFIDHKKRRYKSIINRINRVRLKYEEIYNNLVVHKTIILKKNLVQAITSDEMIDIIMQK